MSDKTITHCKQGFEALKLANIPSASTRWTSVDIRIGNCPSCGLVVQRRYRLSAERELLSGRRGWEDAPKAEHGRIIRVLERQGLTLVRLPVTSEHTINLCKPVDNPRNQRAVRAYGRG